ncbi:MAG TPA: type II toxin-antitoxin system Phd/YefM family antitoxin, partial [Stellaceae bacterium]|nr:type II toxin-antitoxin system Phd/YefM family antitoxin [Stellaceae bacterium]
ERRCTGSPGPYMTIRDDHEPSDMDKDLPHVTAANFKTNCLRLMDEVAQRRTPLVITKRGKPVAKLVPVDNQPIDLFGYMSGTIKICGDIISPIDEEWTADAENIHSTSHQS